MHTRTHLRRSENVEKSKENEKTQSIEVAKNSLNFEQEEGGLNMCASASFTRI